MTRLLSCSFLFFVPLFVRLADLRDAHCPKNKAYSANERLSKQSLQFRSPAAHLCSPVPGFEPVRAPHILCSCVADGLSLLRVSEVRARRALLSRRTAHQ
jgi:hypothetical protein